VVRSGGTVAGEEIDMSAVVLGLSALGTRPGSRHNDPIDPLASSGREPSMTGTDDNTDVADRVPVGASVWERHLWMHLTTHISEEGQMLERYSAIASQTRSSAFAYLVNLLIEDEIRHHRIFSELAASLKTQAELSGTSPVIPYMDFAQAGDGAVLEFTEQLMKGEKQDASTLKRLQRELRDVKDTSLWSLLVDLMERDTQKHIAILRFVQTHAGLRNS
jgi:rubrerythrin